MQSSRRRKSLIDSDAILHTEHLAKGALWKRIVLSRSTSLGFTYCGILQLINSFACSLADTTSVLMLALVVHMRHSSEMNVICLSCRFTRDGACNSIERLHCISLPFEGTSFQILLKRIKQLLGTVDGLAVLRFWYLSGYTISFDCCV